MRRPIRIVRVLPAVAVAAVLAILAPLPVRVPAAAQEGTPPAAAPSPPVVRITSPAGGWTTRRVLPLAGTVAGEGIERVSVNANGTVFTLPVEEGRFSRDVVLAPGDNGFRVTARNAAGSSADEVTVHARVEPKDVRVTLVWDTPDTDVDLWVTDPDGELCKYDRPETAIGGRLDVDVTAGYGPEVFTLARAKPGTYEVRVHYYSGLPPTRARVEVVLHEGTAREERREGVAVLLDQEDVALVLSFTTTGAGE